MILGKTVTTQFAWIDPPPTRNPWNLDRTPGGSSSGSAAAVAVGMCLGADRHPDGRLDHPPGVVLRRGRAQAEPRRSRSRRVEGIVPFAPSLDHLGPIARTVDGLALLFRSSAATGGTTRVVMTIGRPRPSPRWSSGSSATGKGHPGWAGSAASSSDRADPAMREAFDQALAALADAGREVVRGPADRSNSTEVLRDHRVIMASEAAAGHERRPSSPTPTAPIYLPADAYDLLVEEGRLTSGCSARSTRAT